MLAYVVLTEFGPRFSYSNGLTTMVILVSCGLAMAALQEAIYLVHNNTVRVRGQNSDPSKDEMIYVL